MDAINSIELFYLGAALLIIAPGPDFVYVMTQGIARGRLHGVLSAVGISLGLLVHTTLAALGLTALILTSELLFDAIRYIGLTYLVYLGIKAFRSNHLPTESAPDDLSAQSRFRAVRQGMFTNLFNPKAVLTFLAFIPQFISTDHGGQFQIVFLGVSMALLGIVWFSLVGYFAGTVRETVLNSKSNRLISYATGCILIGLGIRLIW